MSRRVELVERIRQSAEIVADQKTYDHLLTAVSGHLRLATNSYLYSLIDVRSELCKYLTGKPWDMLRNGDQPLEMRLEAVARGMTLTPVEMPLAEVIRRITIGRAYIKLNDEQLKALLNDMEMDADFEYRLIARHSLVERVLTSLSWQIMGCNWCYGVETKYWAEGAETKDYSKHMRFRADLIDTAVKKGYELQ